jgi:hypothetical protein
MIGRLPSPRNPRLRAFLSAALLLLSAATAASEDIWVVASQAAPVQQLTRAELADLFLGRADESRFRLRPIDQKDESLRQRFYHALTGQSLPSLRAYWAKQVFAGRGRPPPQLPQAESEHALEQSPDLVTYLPAGQKPAASKVLLILPAGDSP